jgi:hypothetical protein
MYLDSYVQLRFDVKENFEYSTLNALKSIRLTFCSPNIERLAQAVLLLTCVTEAAGSNLARNPTTLIRIL